MGMPLSLWPFGGRDPFESMMADMHRMRSDPNAEVFSSSSVMTYSSTGDGSRPKIYQATTSTRRAPGQVCLCVCVCVCAYVRTRVCVCHLVCCSVLFEDYFGWGYYWHGGMP